MSITSSPGLPSSGRTTAHIGLMWALIDMFLMFVNREKIARLGRIADSPQCLAPGLPPLLR